MDRWRIAERSIKSIGNAILSRERPTEHVSARLSRGLKTGQHV